jgi:hypothetical protein
MQALSQIIVLEQIFERIFLLIEMKRLSIAGAKKAIVKIWLFLSSFFLISNLYFPLWSDILLSFQHLSAATWVSFSTTQSSYIRTYMPVLMEPSVPSCQLVYT